MKRFCILSLILAAAATFTARGQYYEIANQLPQLLRPALSGSANYKGFVEISGLAGVGHNRANVIDFSTSQGFQYNSWFYMGVGVGVDIAMAQQPSLRDNDPDYGYLDRDNKKTKVMIPLFSDFRFNIGSRESTSFFADIRLGAAWMVGNGYLRMADACMSNSTQFYLRPTIGVRMPVKAGDTRHAFNIGITYQLLTSNNNYYRDSNSVSLNNFGASISYEW